MHCKTRFLIQVNELDHIRHSEKYVRWTKLNKGQRCDILVLVAREQGTTVAVMEHNTQWKNKKNVYASHIIFCWRVTTNAYTQLTHITFFLCADFFWPCLLYTLYSVYIHRLVSSILKWNATANLQRARFYCVTQEVSSLEMTVLFFIHNPCFHCMFKNLKPSRFVTLH